MTEARRVRTVSMFAHQGLYVDAHEWSDGRISIEGQHLSGEDEYEYFFMIKADSLLLLKNSLAGGPGDDVLELLAKNGGSIVRQGEMRWLEQHGIPNEFHSYS